MNRIYRVSQNIADIVSARKEFSGGLVGSPTLNRLGLHPLRMLATDALLKTRRLVLAPKHSKSLCHSDLASFLRDGLVLVHPFYPDHAFSALRAEVRALIGETAHAFPRPHNDSERGFGGRRSFPGGFDRFDGSTLNRFVEIDATRSPLAAAAIRDPRLVHLCEMASGFRHAPERFHIYETVQGNPENHDPQQDAHRDTFHSTVKVWLFLDAVSESDGPFAYAPGSHRVTANRLHWEYRRANEACAPQSRRRGGSFRVSDAELHELDVGPIRTFPVPSNTLVLADVRGIHRRSPAASGAHRLALYASLRKWPFSPLPL